MDNNRTPNQSAVLLRRRQADTFLLCSCVLALILALAGHVLADTVDTSPLPSKETDAGSPSEADTEIVTPFDKTQRMTDSVTEAVRHNDLGVAFVFKGEVSQAIDEFKHALRLQPNYFAAHLNLANTLLDIRQYEEAIAEFRESLRLRPDDPKAHNDLGVCLKTQGNLEGAIAEFKTVLRLRPDDIHAHNNLGVALKAKGDLEGAMAEYRTAIDLQPSDVNAHYNLGLALMEARDMEGAVAEFRTALHLRPNDGGIRFNLGTALAHLGKRMEAAQEFRHYLRLERETPANRPWIEQAEANLRDLENP
ncbi:MAG: tetratricopeptide repeat protein [Nitrospiraceae bacterium]